MEDSRSSGGHRGGGGRGGGRNHSRRSGRGSGGGGRGGGGGSGQQASQNSGNPTYRRQGDDAFETLSIQVGGLVADFRENATALLEVNDYTLHEILTYSPRTRTSQRTAH